MNPKSICSGTLRTPDDEDSAVIDRRYKSHHHSAIHTNYLSGDVTRFR